MEGIEYSLSLEPQQLGEVEVGFYATGWQGMLSRCAMPEVESLALEKLEVSVHAIKLQGPPPKTLGFAFPESPSFGQPAQPEKKQEPGSKSGKNPDGDGASAGAPAGPENGSDPLAPGGQGSKNNGGKRTRFAPPKDLVKLEDRLYFLLQPPLETMVESAQLTFPFQPFPYQFEGVAFLFPRDMAILADEMGLGKTMQAITTVRMLLLSGQVRQVLLICPKPLVSNWVREFRLWAPEIPVAVVEGDQAKRQYIWTQPAPVRIANYELMMRDRCYVDTPDQHFDLVILDEAQRIKNKNSTTAEIVRALPRTRSWALTGTPIENSVEDIVNIFEFLSPGYLNTDMHLKSISQATRDYILRRTKDKVLTEMPPKMFRDEEIELTPAQLGTYKEAEDDGVVRLSEMGDTLTIQHVFELVLRLKQICNFDPLTGASSKLERLEADLEEIAASGQKAIVFSQWVESLDKISLALQRFGPLEYHGRVPHAKREGVIARFKEDKTKHVILMSYGAGSVGLNLQFCQYVFLFDRWWNPAIEDQAVNRAHRIGAAGPVTVTRMMAAGTIEERIHKVLEEKRELFNQLFADAAAPRSMGLSQQEIFGLFKLKVPAPTKKAA
jgi:SNF2 family DNA or RNA helicase